jgi:hypothetical protein
MMYGIHYEIIILVDLFDLLYLIPLVKSDCLNSSD